MEVSYQTRPVRIKTVLQKRELATGKVRIVAFVSDSIFSGNPVTFQIAKAMS